MGVIDHSFEEALSQRARRAPLSGSGGKGGKQPKEAPDNLFSNQTATVLDLLSEGEIEGIVGDTDAEKKQSIFYNEVPLHDPNGTPNFTGVSVYGNNGTPDQAPIPGFDALRTTVAVNQELPYNTYKTISFPNDGSITAVLVTISTEGFFEVNKDGDTNGTNCSFVIEVSENGGPFEVVHNGNITGKQQDGFDRDYRIQIDDASGTTAVRVKRTKAESTSLKVNDKISFSNYTKIVEHTFSYPNLAMVGHVLDAKQFGNQVPQRQYRVRGIKCHVPSNYDPITRTYNGPWDGTLTPNKVYTNCGPWVLRELITNKRFGLGQFMEADYIDLPTLYQTGKFADEMVSDGKGGLEPRWTCNTIINTRGEAFNVLKELVSNFRASLYWMQARLWAIGDGPRDPVKIITNANVVDGKFTRTGESDSNRVSVVNVSWNDPDLFMRRAIESVEDPNLIREIGYKTKDFGAFGCTSRAQARRLGRAILFSQEFESEMVSWRASYDHMAVDGDGPDGIAPGDVVLLCDRAQGNAVHGGRIVEVAGNVLTGSSDPFITAVSSGVGTLWLEHSTDGSVELLTCTYDGKEITLTEAPVQPVATNDQYILLADGFTPEMFVVLKITEEDEHLLGLTAVKWDEDRWNAIYEDIHLDTTNYMSLPKATTCEPPSSITVTESFITGVDEYTRTLNVRMGKSNDPYLSHYIVRYSYANSEWITLSPMGAPEVTIKGVKQGSYRVQGMAVNQNGVYSTVVEAQQGVTDVPADEVLAAGDIAGLALQTGGTEFTGKDAKIKWAMVSPSSAYMAEAGITPDNTAVGIADPMFRDCVITVRRASNGSVLRTESVIDTTYSYTWEKNFEDTGGAPERNLRFGVQYRDKYGRLSAERQITVSNPAPVLPLLPQVSGSLDAILVKVDQPNDADWQGISIYTHASPDGVTVTAANLVYKGSNTSQMIPAKGTGANSVIVVPYDVFGPGTPSGIVSASPTDVAVPLSEILVNVSDLQETYGDTASAAQSAQDAAAAVDAAELARDAAQAAKTVAETARDNANTAKTAAQSAQTAAETAQADAVAKAQAAAGSASAAAGSATTASNKADAAAGSASAAAGSATTASTKAGEASTSAGKAATSETNAAGSASAASASQSAAATSETNAGQSASAAASSASIASTKATEAGQSASTATTQAGIATTKAGEASTSATNAATSATNAAGSASSASASQTVAARTAASLMPDNFQQDGKFFTASFASSPDSTGPLTAAGDYSFATDPAEGRVIQVATTNGTFRDVSTVGAVRVAAGRKYRLTWRLDRVTAEAAGVTCGSLYALGLSSAYGYLAAASKSVGLTTTVLPVGAWTNVVMDVDGTTVVNNGAVYLRPLFRTNNGFTIQCALMKVEDVTESTSAAGSASAAATSASTASTKATEAGQSASTATTQAGIATTKAGEANTSATNAAISESNAAGSASSASTSASVAATSQAKAAAYANPAGLVPNGNLDAGDTTWTLTAMTWGSEGEPYGTRFRSSVGAQAYAYSEKFTIDPARKYELTVNFRAYGAAQKCYAGFVCFDAAGNSLGNVYMVGVAGNTFNINAVVDKTQVFTGTGGTIWGESTGFLPGTVRAQALYIGNYQTAAGAYSDLKGVSVFDVTEREAAASSASAAATSASTASTKATEAGNSATTATTQAGIATTKAGDASASASNASISANTASTKAGEAAASASSASGSANTATTKAGDAANSATAAASSAASASTSAAAAQTSATLAANVNTGALNPNPNFTDWPAGQLLPKGWINWQNASSSNFVSREPGLAQVDALTLTQPSAAHDMGIQIPSTTPPMDRITPGRYVLELDASPVSGSGWAGTALGLWCYDINNNFVGYAAIDCFNDKLPDGTAAPWNANVISRWRKLVTVPAGSQRAYLFLFHNYSAVFTAPLTAKSIRYLRAAVRPATAEEVAASTVLPALSATVNQQAGALASIAGKSTAYWQVETNAGAGTDTFISARSETSSPAAAAVTFNSVNGTVTNREFLKTGGLNGAWDGGAYSSEGYNGTAYVSGRKPRVDEQYTMLGLSANQTTALYGSYYAWYYNNIQGWYIFEGATNVGSVAPAKDTDVVSIELSGTTVIYRLNGRVVRTTTCPAGTTWYLSTIAHYSPQYGFRDIVFGPSAPAVQSSVAIGASEFSIYNPSGGGWIKAMTIANGNALFTGGLQAGAYIKLGTGEGWPVALKPRNWQVSDGDVVSFGTTLDELPTLSWQRNNLVALNSGETYSVYAENLTTTGFTARVKINTPSTPSNYTKTTSTQPGTGPTFQIDKTSDPESTTGDYVISYAGTNTVTAVGGRGGPI